MSLLLIVGKLWKHKLATLPVFALVVALSGYVIAVKAPTFDAGGTYILVNPPAPPTDSQIARDPALGRIDTDNPYLQFADQSLLVQVLASKLNSPEVRAAVAKQGGDPNYTAAPSSDFGINSPILQITGSAATPAAAVGTAKLVGRAFAKELDTMQAIRRVDPAYRITSEAVVAPEQATLKTSGKLRALVAVFALGAVLLFIVISAADAVGALRAGWAQGRPDPQYVDLVGSVEPLIQPDPPSDPLEETGRDTGQWLRAQRS